MLENISMFYFCFIIQLLLLLQPMQLLSEAFYCFREGFVIVREEERVAQVMPPVEEGPGPMASNPTAESVHAQHLDHIAASLHKSEKKENMEIAKLLRQYSTDAEGRASPTRLFFTQETGRNRKT